MNHRSRPSHRGFLRRRAIAIAALVPAIGLLASGRVPDSSGEPTLEETRLVMSKWIETQQIISKEAKDWARAYWQSVHPYNLGGAYPNFMMDDEGDARIRASFGDNYGRLSEIKRKYDPANLFRVNQNIRPAAGG